MKKSEVKVSFDADKLSAVKQYMEKKDADIQAELEETIGKLYEKFVPAAVREYIEFNAQDDGDTQPKAKKAASNPAPIVNSNNRSTNSGGVAINN